MQINTSQPGGGLDTKFQVLNLLSKLYAGNTTNEERRATEQNLAELGKFHHNNYKMIGDVII